MMQIILLSCVAVSLVLGGVPGLVFAQATDSFTIRQQYGDDTTPPTVPSPITATPVAATQIDITWGAATDDNVLAGYRLFRGGVQIATTTLLTYSDTGLTPSTTYAYYVEAFDLFGNTSTSSATVSTTTDPLPTVPEETPTTPQSTVLPPRLTTFDLDPGTESARFAFGTLQPVTYIIRYGTTDAVTGGFVQSDLFKKDHTTILTDLEPLTTYFYVLYAKDRFGREERLREGSFTTLSRYTLAAAPNVSYFTATVSGASVLLKWGNPVGDTLGYVRVVRSHYGYPTSPTDGFVVYEGLDDSYFDTNALGQHEIQYYTVFAYNIDGMPSSGAVARAVRAGVVLPPQAGSLPTSIVGAPVASSSTTTLQLPEIFRLTFADITVIQFDALIPASAEIVTVAAGESFVIRVPATLVPMGTKTIIVTWQHPTKADRTTSYLLRLNDDKTHYEAMASGMDESGLYPLQLSVFDRNTVLLGSISGVIEVTTTDAAVAAEETVLYVATTYIVLGGIIGLLTMLGLWWLLLLLLRLLFGDRRSDPARRIE
jgi:hypothetical protein